MSSLPSTREPRRKGCGARHASNSVPEPLEARRLFVATTIFSENFDNLDFGPAQEEAAAEDVWTNVPPAGWLKDDSQIPGFDNPPEDNGVTEWIGWTFAQKDWWTRVAGDQTRTLFEEASGGVMIADPDEWDDQTHPGKTAGWPADMLYNARIFTPAVPLAGVTPGTAAVNFSSSWRPEAFDDGANVNNQTGTIDAIYSDGSTERILHWDSDPFGEFFHPDSQNEQVSVPLTIPAGAASVKLLFTLGQAANDWWWAVDNLAITADVENVSAPKVQQVFVNGPGLTGQTSANGVAFRNLGGIDNTYGYPVPAGANQTRSIPWNAGVSQVALRFTEDVASSLQQDDLVVRGSNTATYATSAFTYDAATRTGVWTLATPITNDKVRLFLDDALVANLDGEWQDANAAESYPSGNGTAGGDFSFRFNVLRGDATQDGVVNALDLSFVKQRLNRTATNPGTTGAVYSVFADLTADGSINALDLSAAKQRLNSRLPTADPASALLFSAAPISR